MFEHKILRINVLCNQYKFSKKWPCTRVLQFLYCLHEDAFSYGDAAYLRSNSFLEIVNIWN